jgi:hypothetical protein
MVRFQRLGRAKNGKLLEAIRFAKEVAEYINTKYPPVSVQVYIVASGDYGTIYWYADYRDFAAFESVSAQLRSDQGYWVIVNKAMEWFIEGCFHDTLMSSV